MKLSSGAATSLFLFLGSSSATTVAVTTSCSSTADCSSDEYCAEIVNECKKIGDCVESLDCSNPENSPYAAALCMGSLECQEGKCVNECGPPKCETTNDCASPNEYCNGEGICQQVGNCVSNADCFNADNGPLAVNMCAGTLMCMEGRCNTNCGVFLPTDNEVIDPGFGVPEPPTVDQMPATMEEEDTTTIDPDFGVTPPSTCETVDDCSSDGEYCNGDGICQPVGTCVADQDCFNAENAPLAVNMCAGTLMCMEGRCNTNCGVFVPTDEVDPEFGVAPPTVDQMPAMMEDTTTTTTAACETSNDCEETFYCSQTVNECVPVGSCKSNDDCFDIDNAPLAVNMCVGTLECNEEDRCAMNCGPLEPVVAPEVNPDFSVDPPELCASNNDCAEGEYCGRGSCIPTGQCRTDSDCHNPNNLYPAVLCVGYVSCNTDEGGYCENDCSGSMCPPGKVYNTECTTPTVCDRRIAIPGAVHCVVDTCSDDCAGIFYDASGNVILIDEEEEEKSAPSTTTTAKLTRGNEIEDTDSFNNETDVVAIAYEAAVPPEEEDVSSTISEFNSGATGSSIATTSNSVAVVLVAAISSLPFLSL